MADTSPRPPSRIHVTWAGAHRFDAGRPGGPTLRVDGDGEVAQTPVDALLTACATCSAADVVDILAKRRTPAERLEIDVTGERVTSIPRRFRHVTLEFHVDGAGIDRAHAERAIELAMVKYCSVRASLAPDITIDWRLTLNGERGELLTEPPAREPEPAEG